LSKRLSSGASLGTDLTSGSVFSQLVFFSLPILAANIIQQLYQTIDMIVIGKFVGSTGTIGVSVGGQAAILFTIIAIALAGGGQIYISQLMGARDKEGIQSAIGTLFTTTFTVSIAMMVLGLVFSKDLLRLLNAPPEAMSATSDFMRITCLGFPFIFGYNAVCAVLQGMGDSKRPLIFICAAALINVVLGVIFVGVFKWSTVGTALATVIAQGFSCMFALVYLFRHKDAFGFDFKLRRFRVNRKHLRVLLRLSLPMLMQNGLIIITLMYVNSLINAYGVVASATNSIGDKVFTFASISTQSLSTAGAAMIGQNLGAGKPARVKRIVLSILILAASLGVLSIAMSLIIPRQIFTIFSDDPAVIEYGVKYLRVSVITFILAALMSPFFALVNGSGFALLGLLVGILDGVVFRLGLAWLFSSVFTLGVPGYWLASALARLGPLIVCFIYYASGKWKTRKLLVDVPKTGVLTDSP